MIAPRTKSTVGDSREKQNRLGLTVSKRVGGSVIRNRVKRCIREWFRHAREGLPARSDIVVIARRTARGLSGGDVAANLNQVIQATVFGGGGRTTAESR